MHLFFGHQIGFFPLFLQELDWSGWFVLALLAITLVLLVKEIFPINITLFIAGIIPVIFGIVPPQKFLQAIMNESIITIAMLFVIIQAFEEVQLVQYLSRKILPKKNKPKFSLILPPISLLSAFLNNTPLVMALVPIIRKWCQDARLSPSKFFIPISFAAILGGTCTLIGTSTNLVVNALLSAENASLMFFEIGKIGFICTIVGLIYLIFFSSFLLPERIAPRQFLQNEIKNVTKAFFVEKKCPWIGRSVQDIAKLFLHGSFRILEIQRNKDKITAPRPFELIQENDHVIIVGDLKQIATLHKIQNLRPTEEGLFHLEEIFSHYMEVLIPSTSYLVGKTLKKTRFRHRYGGFVFAIHRGGQNITTNISEMTLKAGDLLMVLSSNENEEKYKELKDLYPLGEEEKISFFSPVKSTFVCLVFFAMILFAALGFSLMIASMTAAIVLLLTKFISARKVIKKMNWDLLILIAGGFALSTALDTAGVAEIVGQALMPILGKNPYLMIAIIFFTTSFFTELITNTAAVLILFPIFYQGLQTLGLYSPEAIKAVGVTLAIAASCSFITPIGYQTNTIVYGPGGYRFIDYMKIGLPLNLILGALCIWLIPFFWPFA